MGKLEILVVGGGPSAVAAICAIVDQAIAGDVCRKVRVTVVERGGEAFRGLAFGTEDDGHLTNMPAHSLRIPPREPHDFLKWGVEHGHVSTFAARGSVYVPRRVLGDYLAARAMEACEVAERHGLQIDLMGGDVVRLKRDGEGWTAELATGRTLRADQVLLTIGNLPSSRLRRLEGATGFIPHAWPARRLEAIPRDARVGVVGTSLTAIDVLATLESQEHEGPVTWGSRSGLLPRVRPDYDADQEIRHLTPERLQRLATAQGRGLSLDQLFMLWSMDCVDAGLPVERIDFLRPDARDPAERLRDELAASGSPDLRFSLLRAATENSAHAWRALSPHAKRTFSKRWSTAFGASAFPCPPRNGARVLGWLESGRVSHPGQLATGVDAVRACSKGFEMTYADGSVERVDWLIDATGGGYELTASGDPLIRGLLADGHLRAHPFGGGDVDFETGAVIGRDGRVARDLHLIGAQTRGVHFFTNSLEKNALAACAAVRSIFRPQRQARRLAVA
ncbi:FAD/NAD(P)-binding protein [Albimonas pacifica]|uniref:Uncharacterized NAD(P)/FAD-binding protein YdhS n=1 Tax=Albimonas pacifica TaxID=1114924 RepID=A0A1I3Q9W6_9RHOB|nr:FAD/NAD(P)-binding protein [Albimonas pacifica]SFJ31074.1 Uncharacterized NAD(P)/FAD-binding protein YdhS [Albimonas pacifica]